MRVLYKKEDGSKIVFDSREGDYITAHVVSPEGKEFEPMSLENILSKGYWEAVDPITQ